MSVTSGFFNSLNHDRRYDALTFSRVFDGMIVDGVYSTIGEKFIVKAGTGMMVMVGSGRAWFHHTWTLNDTDYPLTFEEAEPVLSRIDVIVLEINLNEDVRENSIKIIKGVPSSSPVKPTLIKSDYLNQYPLAYVTIPNDSTEILQSNIENMVGTSECPFATALLEHVTTNELILQWKAQWDEYISKASADADAWTAAFELRLVNWVAGLRDILDTQAAGHLQNQIDGLADIISYVEYVDANDKTTVITSKAYTYGDSIIVNYGTSLSPKLYYAITDIPVGTTLIEGTHMVSDRVWDRINKMFKTNVFKLHNWGWDVNPIPNKWGYDNLYPYVLKVEDIWIPSGHMPDARSCGETIDTPATEEEAGAYAMLIDKAEIDRVNKTVTFYSEERLTDFYICINGISGDVDGGIVYDKTTLAGIKEIVNAHKERHILSVGDVVNVELTESDDPVWGGAARSTVVVPMVIVAINHDPEYQHQVILGSRNSMPVAKRFHSTSTNVLVFYSPGTAIPDPLNPAPTKSEIGELLNGVGFYDLLKFSDRNAISVREYYRSDGGANVTTVHKEIGNYIWLPRAMEIMGAASGGSQTEADTTTQFEWYKTAANRVKTVNNAANYWWTSTPTLANAVNILLMNNANGTMYGNGITTNAYGISPHFHIVEG